MVKIHGKEFTTLPELLEKGHEDGLSSIQTKVIALPFENADGVAIVQATVVTERGTFQGTGDAAPNSVGEGIEVHLVRMAETRAISRALRWATNTASTAEAEVDQSHPAAIFDQRMRGDVPSNGDGDKKISSRQLGLVLRLIRERGQKQEDLREEVLNRYDRPLDQLSISEASELIQELMAA